VWGVDRDLVEVEHDARDLHQLLQVPRPHLFFVSYVDSMVWYVLCLAYFRLFGIFYVAQCV